MTPKNVLRRRMVVVVMVSIGLTVSVCLDLVRALSAVSATQPFCNQT